MLIRSGCFGARFGEGEPLVAKVGDDLQAAAEGFDLGARVRSSVVPIYRPYLRLSRRPFSARSRASSAATVARISSQSRPHPMQPPTRWLNPEYHAAATYGGHSGGGRNATETRLVKTRP